MPSIPASSAFVALLVDLSIKAAVLGAIVAVSLRLFRVKSPAITHCVWLAVLLGTFAYPIMQAVLPVFTVPVVAGRATSIRSFSFLDPDWSGTAAAVYVGGVLALGFRLLAGCMLTRSVVRSARPIDEPQWNGYCAARGSVRTLSRGPMLFESSNVRIPVTIGAFRPRILLPLVWRTWDTDTMRSVLSHEMAHVRRWDVLWQIVSQLHVCLLWFHPLAWYLQRQVGLSAEKACDAEAVLDVGDSCTYAQVLLDMTTMVSGHRQLVSMGVPVARCQQIKPRIEAILAVDRSKLRRLALPQALAVVLAATALWAGAAIVCWERQCASHSGAFAPTGVVCAPRCSTTCD